MCRLIAIGLCALLMSGFALPVPGQDKTTQPPGQTVAPPDTPPAQPTPPPAPPQPAAPGPAQPAPVQPAPIDRVPVPPSANVQAPPPPPLPSPFIIPPGLSMPPDQLFAILGYCPTHCVAITPETSFDIAYACYIRCLYGDAAIFAQHGTTMRNDARLQLLKGVCLLHLGDCTKAEATAADYRAAVALQQNYGLGVARERVNGPMRVRFDQVVDYQARIIR